MKCKMCKKEFNASDTYTVTVEELMNETDYSDIEISLTLCFSCKQALYTIIKGVLHDE